MAQKSRMKTAVNGARFPKEAFDYNDDVIADVVRQIRDERGVQVEANDEWEVVDGFGKVIHA